jgi:transcription elongation factor Elf1
MGIKSRLDQVYPKYDLVSYSRLSGSIRSECPECGEEELEVKQQYYPEADSWVECLACGSSFDFRVETSMWIKRREEKND